MADPLDPLSLLSQDVYSIPFLDLAVSAPYERSKSSTMNTGTVYIFHGHNTKEEFENQIPQRVSNSL